MTLIELATGSFPFPAETLSSVLDLLRYIEEEPAPTLDRRCFSESFCEFVSSCLIKDHLQRPGPQKLLQDPFLQTAGVDLAQWIKEAQIPLQ